MGGARSSGGGLYLMPSQAQQAQGGMRACGHDRMGGGGLETRRRLKETQTRKCGGEPTGSEAAMLRARGLASCPFSIPRGCCAL